MHYLNALMITVGALLFIYPIIIFRRLFRLTKALPYRQHWIALIIFVACFFVGYMIVTINIINKNDHLAHDSIIALIMFFGAVFVVLSSLLFYRIINSLDQLVKSRTSELEKQHEEAIKKDRELLGLKDQFLFVAAHELRAPVTAMKWNLDVLFEDDGKEVKKCGPESIEMLEDVRRNNEYLVDLVNDLLDASRMEYGTFELQNSKFNVCEVCTDVVAAVKPLTTEHGLSIDFVCPIKSIEIESDVRRLKEVLVNLLSNAIKYNVDGGKVDLKLEPQDNELRFDVIDTGIGIAAEDKSKLFKKFSRLDAGIPDGVRGTGLGLYITKQIIERMGGRIWAESEGLGHGSTFSFVVTLKPKQK